MLITFLRVCLCALLALLASTRAANAEPPQIVRLHYDADPSCPDVTRFRAEVLARITRPVSFRDQVASRTLRVRLRAEKSGIWAELWIEGPGQPPSRREFRTANCEDALRALALVSALAIDPNASLAADPRVSERPTPPPTSHRVTPVPVPAPQSSEQPAKNRFEVGAVLGAISGPAPELLVNGGIQAALDVSAGFSVLVPRLALGLLGARSGVLGASIGQGDFTWTALRLGACPLRFRLGSQTALRICSITDAGLVFVEGNPVAIENPDSAARAWLASGLSLLLQQRIGRMILGASAGALVSLTRDSFVFYTPLPRPIHDVPALVWTTELSFGFILGSSSP
jgi:hypothetical protein